MVYGDSMHTLTEAAKLLGLAPSTLRHQVRNGKLDARKVSRDWYVRADEVERYRRENRRATDKVSR
jgi:excisionase family DNA binding protein